MKQCISILAFLLASTLCGCSVLLGSAADPGSPAGKLQTVLQGHPDSTLNKLRVTEYKSVLYVNGFVNTLGQKNAVDSLISNYTVINSVGFEGRIVNRVGLYADYDCHASEECIVNDNCLGDTRCLNDNGCDSFDECL